MMGRDKSKSLSQYKRKSVSPDQRTSCRHLSSPDQAQLHFTGRLAWQTLLFAQVADIPWKSTFQTSRLNYFQRKEIFVKTRCNCVGLKSKSKYFYCSNKILISGWGIQIGLKISQSTKNLELKFEHQITWNFGPGQRI